MSLEVSKTTHARTHSAGPNFRNAKLFFVFVRLSLTPTHLQQHVPRLYASICSHGASFHDGANVDPSISPLITLTNNTNAQEVVLLCEAERSLKLHSSETAKKKKEKERQKRWSSLERTLK